MKFCQNCGKKIPASAKFCTYCGAEQTEQNANHEQPRPERKQSRTYGNVNDEDYWYTHGFFTSIIQCGFIYRFMWASLLGLIGVAIFILLGLRYGGQNLSLMPLMIIIGLVVGIILFILTFSRHFLIAMNRKLTISCYRFMHHRHPEYSTDDIYQIVNHRIRKFDSIMWKALIVLVCLAFSYFIFVAIFCLVIFLLVGSVIFGTVGTRHWHPTSSHWY